VGLGRICLFLHRWAWCATQLELSLGQSKRYDILVSVNIWAELKIDSIKSAVEIFPFVPVIPIKFNCLAGCQNQRLFLRAILTKPKLESDHISVLTESNLFLCNFHFQGTNRPFY